MERMDAHTAGVRSAKSEMRMVDRVFEVQRRELDRLRRVQKRRLEGAEVCGRGLRGLDLRGAVEEVSGTQVIWEGRRMDCGGVGRVRRVGSAGRDKGRGKGGEKEQ